MSPADDNQRLFDIPDGVVYLQGLGAKAASENFLRNLIATGQVAHLKIGKKFYVSKSALDRWIEMREKRKQ